MSDVVQYAVLGLGIGAIYALLAQGLVVIYGGAGVLNLSHAAMAMLAAYVYRQLHVVDQWPAGVALVATVALGVAIAVGLHLVVMRPLRDASPLSRVVATLGALAALQGVVMLAWGTRPYALDSLLGSGSLSVGGVEIIADRVWTVLIAAAVTAALWLVYRYTAIGLAIRGAADAPRVAAGLGWSPSSLALITWSVGGGLAALAGILIAPMTGLNPDLMPLYVIPVTAAALIGRFSSFPLTLLGALAIGIAQSELTGYVDVQGAVWAIPFLLIVALILVRGKGIAAKGFNTGRLPAVGSGRVHPLPTAVALIVGAYLILTVFPIELLDGLIVSLGWATVMLSVVVLLGLTNQLSFEQMAMAGLTALVAATLLVKHQWPFGAALVASTAASVVIGVAFALPALRTRGVNLAVVTLGLSVVIFQGITTNTDYTGGADGLMVGAQTLFGINIDTIVHPERYALVAMLLFAACSLGVANLRRGAAGTALTAVRTNERAAAALGISVFGVKLYAFVVGATIAGLGGTLLAFRGPIAQFGGFDPLSSVLAVSYAVIGGVGFAVGPLFGSMFVAGGMGTWIMDQIWPGANPGWLILIGGVSVMVVIVTHPDGIVALQVKQMHALRARFRRAPRRVAPTPVAEVAPPRIQPRIVAVSNATVRFGGVTALSGVSLAIQPGQIVGLIGPNGAGKSTLIDAVTGFVRPADASVTLDGKPIDAWPAHKRAAAGISRTFQSLELFEESTVRDNLQVACDRRNVRAYARDIVLPRRSSLSPAATAAITLLGLNEQLDERVQDLPFGRRRLVAIARALATAPSVLLLDEPASGLSTLETTALVSILRTLAEDWGIAILLVEHEMSLVMSTSDRVVVLEFGRKIADGDPNEVSTDPAVVAAYLGTEPELDETAVVEERA